VHTKISTQMDLLHRGKLDLHVYFDARVNTIYFDGWILNAALATSIYLISFYTIDVNC